MDRMRAGEAESPRGGGVGIGGVRTGRGGYDSIEAGDKGGVEGNWLALRRPEQLQPGDLPGIERAAKVGQLLRGGIPQQRISIETDGLRRWPGAGGGRGGLRHALILSSVIRPADRYSHEVCSGAASAPSAPPRGCGRERQQSACR